MTEPPPGAELRKHLDRWVAEGLIDTAQATRIETAETPAAGPPAATGYFAAGIGVLAGAQFTMQVAAGYALALATVAGLLAAGVQLRQAWLVVLGALGVLLVTPQITTRYLPVSAATPVAIFVAGVVLLGSAVWLARRRAGSR